MIETLTRAPLPDVISRLLARPDLAIAPHERSIVFDPALDVPFQVAASGQIRLGPNCLGRTEQSAGRLRHALELALLLPRLPQAPVLAGLAAARVAARFALRHDEAAEASSESWITAMAAPDLPPALVLGRVWTALASLQPPTNDQPDSATCARLATIWTLLGPTESLLQSGGDQRLLVDPATGLNFYGCSHRPRPWAVTFASSTASSSSERGFAGAEAARQRVTVAALAGHGTAALDAEAEAIRAAIARHTGLAAGGGVVLAASGTDCELLALTLAAGAPDRPITTILVAPEETGSGVPLAATGCHFAADTARGVDVIKGARVAGMPPDVQLARLPARGPDGAMRPAAEIDAACAEIVEAAISAGRHVILHLLDISKTGYLAPNIAAAAAIAARHGDRVRVVVDACQLRLTRDRCADYLARGWFVLITGSKFLTGPPFAGAVLVPPPHAHLLHLTPPAGLADYTSRPEWPAGAATEALPADANYGLLLRWHAALAEWDALDAIPPARQHEVLTQFCARVRQGIAANPDLALLDTPAPARPDYAWDSVPTIISFLVRPATPLDPADARRVYHWLNADLRPALPPDLEAEHERLACLRCHIGQPVPLPGADGPIGVLRISAGARLVSGEPSHHDLDENARLLREIRDALSVLDKISLILAHWAALSAADPRPSF